MKGSNFLDLKLQIFVFFLLIFLTSGGGHLDETDGVLFFAITENMIKHHSIKLPVDASVYEKTGIDIKSRLSSIMKITDGNSSMPLNESLQSKYVGYGLLLSVIAIPFYLISLAISIDPVHFVPYFLNSLILSITALMVFLVSKEIFSSNKISFVLSIVFSVTSFVWPYINSMWQQPLVSLTLISSIYFLLLSKKTDKSLYVILSAIFLGLTIQVHPESLVLIPFFFVYSICQFRKNKKFLLVFPIAFAPLVVLQGYLNYIRFGSILDFGYSNMSGLSFHHSVEGIAGLIISPGYGILFFFPLFVLVPFSIFLFYKNYSKSMALLTILAFTITWLYFGSQTSPYWAHGEWGPRHFVIVMPFIVLSLGSFIKKYSKKISAKITFIVLAITGFIVNVLGVLVWWMYAYSYGWQAEELWRSKDSLSIFAWDPYHSTISESVKVLSSDFLLHVNPGHNFDYRMIGWAPCRYDNLLFCNFGIWPILLLFPIIVMLSIFIIKKIRREDKKQNIQEI